MSAIDKRALPDELRQAAILLSEWLNGGGTLQIRPRSVDNFRAAADEIDRLRGLLARTSMSEVYAEREAWVCRDPHCEHGCNMEKREMKITEVIARAIFKGDMQDSDPDAILTDGEGEKTGEPAWTLYTSEAEAVIAALAMPTPEMMAAGLEWIGSENKPQDWRATAVANVWAAMLKAA